MQKIDNLCALWPQVSTGMALLLYVVYHLMAELLITSTLLEYHQQLTVERRGNFMTGLFTQVASYYDTTQELTEPLRVTHSFV